jgi:hypothetical protein
MRIDVWLVVALGMSACGKSPEEQGEKAAGELFAKSAREDLVKLEQAIASPDPGKGKYECAGNMANIARLEKVDKALADDVRQLCTKDLYLAMIKVEVEKAEAARKAKPDDLLANECFSAYYEFAKDRMTEYKTIDLAKDLIARFEKACPPRK